MGINKKIGIQQVEYFRKCLCVSAVTFNEVSVQVVISTIATKTIFPWTILIGTRGGVPIQRAADVVKRNDCNNHVAQMLFVSVNILDKIPGKPHRCINTIRFSRMNCIVDEKNGTGIRQDIVK